ncbi:MAG TPA: 3-deoxy-D-manno-octulosonic acid transferase [Pirellulaceae bacterium]
MKNNDDSISSFSNQNSYLLGQALNVLYLGAIFLALPWLLYQRLRHGKYREGFRAKFLGDIPQRKGDKPCLWLHAVSVGEVNLLEPILKCWEHRNPDWDIVISTTTQTGCALAKKKYAPRTIIYCPLDFSWAVSRAMGRVRPSLLVLTELELWPNLVAAAKRHGAKVAVINGRLGEKSFRGYHRIKWLAQGVFRQIDVVAAQNDEYAERFVALGADAKNVYVTGSIKFDGARTDRQSSEIRRLANLAGITEGDIIFLAGSTQDPEESLALSVFENLSAEFPRLKLILVPRHPERFNDVAAMLGSRGVRYQRRSQMEQASGGRQAPGIQNYREAHASRSPETPLVTLIDVVGELGHWWGMAKIAFVGGSLTNRGGQNMSEPAAYGAAVSFGPNTWNFRDVVTQFLTEDAAVVVKNDGELEAFVRRCLTEPDFAESLGRRAKALVLRQQGATDRTIQLLEQVLSIDNQQDREKAA